MKRKLTFKFVADVGLAQRSDLGVGTYIARQFEDWLCFNVMPREYPKDGVVVLSAEFMSIKEFRNQHKTVAELSTGASCGGIVFAPSLPPKER